jgi:signal peptidase I
MITFRVDDILITHRIVDIGHDGEYYYITKGDANVNPDPQPVRPNQIVGEVYSVMPAYMITALRLIRTPVAQLALIPTLLICVLSMLRPYRYN